MSLLRHIVCLFIAMLISALGASMAFAIPLNTSEILFYQTENLHSHATASVNFEARAPPLDVSNVVVTGGVTVMQGSTFALRGQETVAVFFGFNADHNAPNRVPAYGTGEFAFDMKIGEPLGLEGSAARNQEKIAAIAYLLSNPGAVLDASVDELKATMAEASRLWDQGDFRDAQALMARAQLDLASLTTGTAALTIMTAKGARAMAKVTGQPVVYRELNPAGAQVTSADLPQDFTRVAHPNGDIVIRSPDGTIYRNTDEIPQAAFATNRGDLVPDVPENVPYFRVQGAGCRVVVLEPLLAAIR